MSKCPWVYITDEDDNEWGELPYYTTVEEAIAECCRLRNKYFEGDLFIKSVENDEVIKVMADEEE